MKKLLCILLALAAALSMGTACASGNRSLSGTLRVIGPGPLYGPGAEGGMDLATGEFQPGYMTLLEEFNEDFPKVRVEFLEMSWHNWRDVLHEAGESGAADILLHGAMLTDVVMDLTPYLEETPELYDYMLIGPEEYRDPRDCTRTVPTGISYVVDPYYVAVDTLLFDQWGVEVPDADWTWEDLLDLAAMLTGINPVTDEINYGVLLFNAADENIWKAPSSYMAAKGVDNHHYDETYDKLGAWPTFDSRETVSALQYFNDLNRFQPPEYVDGMGGAGAFSGRNTVAMRLTEGMMSAHRNTVFYNTDDRYVYLPLPVNEDPDDARYSSFAGTASIAISRNAAEPDLAWEFIKWVIMDEDAQLWLHENLSCSPTYQAVELMQEDELPFADCYESILSDYWKCSTVTQYDAIDVTFGNVQTAWAAAFRRMLSGHLSPDEAAQRIQDAVIGYMEENR